MPCSCRGSARAVHTAGGAALSRANLPSAQAGRCADPGRDATLSGRSLQGHRSRRPTARVGASQRSRTGRRAIERLRAVERRVFQASRHTLRRRPSRVRSGRLLSGTCLCGDVRYSLGRMSLDAVLCRDPRLPGLRRRVAARAAAGGAGRPPTRILIAGQAPGRRVHESGLPFDDPSGDRLRGLDGRGPRDLLWRPGDRRGGHGLLLSRDRSGTAPTIRRCRAARRSGGRRLLAELPNVELTLLVGGYAQAWTLGKARPELGHRNRAGLARLPAGRAADAAPLLAQHRLAEAQSVVRGGGRALSADRVSPDPGA